MPTATLFTTTVFACLVALGCRDRAVEAPVPPSEAIQRTTTILGAPPAAQNAKPARRSTPEAPRPAPAMSTPAAEEALDAPAPSPAPVPTVPRRPHSRYEDGCGRPLVA